MSETLSFCAHGVPVKLGICNLCGVTRYIDSRYEKIKEFNPEIVSLKEKYDEATRRISKLEKWKEIAIEKNIQDIQRIRELEKKFSDLEQLFYDEKEKFRCPDKKPHKCPVCDGCGKTKHPINGLLMCKCDSCEGKGIVWG